MLDTARLARLQRARDIEERRVRLGYPQARARRREVKRAEQKVLRGDIEPVTPGLR